MKYQFNHTADVKFSFNANGEVEFTHNSIVYRSVGQATFDNSQSNNYSTYSAPLVCPESDYPDDIAGRIEWDIIKHECDDESDACDWDKFSIYFC